jgi:hypothetical protein
MVVTAMPAAGAASTAQTYRVEGTQTAVDASHFDMHPRPGRAGLHGKWTTTSVTHDKVVPPYYFATGTEQFDGCIDINGSDSCGSGEPNGQMFFNFVFWERFDRNGAEIEGGCVHPITGGTRDFTNAAGLLTMRDFLVGRELRTTYQGTVVVQNDGALRAGQADNPALANATAESQVAHPSAC